MLWLETGSKETDSRGAVFNNPGKKIRMTWAKKYSTGAGSILGNTFKCIFSSWRYSIELLKTNSKARILKRRENMVIEIVNGGGRIFTITKHIMIQRKELSRASNIPETL